MPELIAARTRWGFLRILHPLFASAESLPSIEAADLGHYGSGVFEDSPVDELGHLKNEITILRNDLRLNVIKQQLVDTELLTEDDSTVEGLETDLQSLLEQLEDLIDPAVLGEEFQVNLHFFSREAEAWFCRPSSRPHFTTLCRRGIVFFVSWHPALFQATLSDTGGKRTLALTQASSDFQYSSEPESLACFPRLVALRNILKGAYKDCAAPDEEKTSAYTGPTELTWSRRYSPTLVTHVSCFIRFPQNAAKIESCRRTISRFGTALDRILDNSALSWLLETQMLDYRPRDLEAIQHAHDFASTCTSLFSQMVDAIKCGPPHQAKLHLSGFKQDQLQMNIRTCKGADWISAVFTR